jgi:hypothetical protein
VAARILGLALIASLLAASAAAAQVAYVGDSLGVGTVPPLRDRLASISVDADVETGRASPEGVSVLSSILSPAHQVVVFDLGTNDDPAAPQVLASDLASARELAGDRCMVIATINRPPFHGAGPQGLNRVIASFAAGDPATEVVDWRAAVAGDPALVLDGIHAGPEGYGVRAGLFADAIERCLLLAGGSQAPPAPKPQPAPEPTGPAPTPRSPRAPDPVRQLANELARAVAVGAEFG